MLPALSGSSSRPPSLIHNTIAWRHRSSVSVKVRPPLWSFAGLALLAGGPAVVGMWIDSLAYADSKDKSIIGIELHSGRNRIVRRIFEHLGYEVVKLDRVVYSNLTKKDLPRGHWRYLEEKEIIQKAKNYIKLMP